MDDKRTFKYGDSVLAWDSIYNNHYVATYLAHIDCAEIDEPHIVSLKDSVGIYTFKHCRQLIEVDTPVWVQDKPTLSWLPQHFAQWSDDGKVMTFPNGTTSHSTGYTCELDLPVWEHCTFDNPHAGKGTV